MNLKEMEYIYLYQHEGEKKILLCCITLFRRFLQIILYVFNLVPYIFNFILLEPTPPRAQGLLTEIWQRRKRQK